MVRLTLFTRISPEGLPGMAKKYGFLGLLRSLTGPFQRVSAAIGEVSDAGKKMSS